MCVVDPITAEGPRSDCFRYHPVTRCFAMRLNGGFQFEAACMPSPRMRPRSARVTFFDSHIAATHLRTQKQVARSSHASGLLSPHSGVIASSRRPQSATVSLNSPRAERNMNFLSPRAEAGVRLGSVKTGTVLPAVNGQIAQWLLRQNEIRGMVEAQRERISQQLEQREVVRRARAEKASQRAALAEMERLLEEQKAEQKLKEERRKEADRMQVAAEAAMIAAQARAKARVAPSAASIVRVHDEELRRIHQSVQLRLEGRQGGVRGAFIYFDKDGTGTITADELVQGLLDLNVNVAKWKLEHMVNVCDHDRGMLHCC